MLYVKSLESCVAVRVAVCVAVCVAVVRVVCKVALNIEKELNIEKFDASYES